MQTQSSHKCIAHFYTKCLKPILIHWQYSCQLEQTLILEYKHIPINKEPDTLLTLCNVIKGVLIDHSLHDLGRSGYPSYIVTLGEWERMMKYKPTPLV